RSIKPNRLGIEHDGLTVEEYKVFDAWFDTAELVDVSVALMNQRLLKSEEEVYLIRQGARIADIGARAVKNAIREGITEYKLALISKVGIDVEMSKVVWTNKLRVSWSLVNSGIISEDVHNWSTSRQLQYGDILSVNLFPMMLGHYTAMERTMFLGQPDKRSLE